MQERTRHNIIGRIIPVPREIQVHEGAFLPLENGVRVCLDMPHPGEQEIELIHSAFRTAWKVVPEIETHATPMELPDEGYRIDVEASSLRIGAGTLQGLRYALFTIRQAAEPLRNLKISNAYALPRISVRDWPALPFRGMHLCVFPETELPELEKMIRLAAYYKLNNIVLEPWGTFPFQCEPDFVWPDPKMKRVDFEKIRDLAVELGITIIPQINILGHASWSRGGTAKHATLNFHPEYAPLFDPDGWCWCLTNPETKRLLEALITEIHDFFGRPPFFHIGCDEAYSLASCSLCAEHDSGELAASHILHFHDFLAARGTRSMMWHDMLIQQKDYPHYVACGKPSAENFLAGLPRDIVICDWQYETDLAATKGEWASTRYFMEKGFETMLCPWFDMAVINSQGKFMAEHKGFGLLCTTWHLAKGYRLYGMYFATANMSWNPDCVYFDEVAYGENFALHIRDVDRDAGVEKYEYFGKISQYQIAPDKALE